MSQDKIVDAFFWLMDIAACLYILYGPSQRLTVDIARQKLFELRDSIFDLALDSQSFTFQSREYKEIRRYFNNLIRFAHVAKWYLLILTPPSSPPGVSIREIIENIKDDEIRKAVSAKYDEALAVFQWLVVARSPLIFAAYWITLPFSFTFRYLSVGRGMISNIKEKMVQRIEQDSARDISAIPGGA